nr:DUF6179 domain-containing protein [uncultured Aminipila sp.]
MEDKNNNYLAALLNLNLQNEGFTEAEMSSIKCNMISLLGERTERYTMGESSSVPVEKAEELFKSICFTLGLVTGKQGISSLKTENMSSLLKAGWNIIESMVEEGQGLFKQVIESTVLTENISYNDTLQGIEKFFKRYEYHFFAHEIPGDIDYQLCIPISEALQGIEYINEYLHRLLLENRFCEHFERNGIIRLLQSYCPDYKGLLINIFEPVAINTMGLAVINKNVIDLDISDYDRKRILAELDKWPDNEVIIQLDRVVDIICSQLEINEMQQRNYLYEALFAQYPRVKNQVALKNLNGIFLSLLDEDGDNMIKTQYVDGNIMEDERLRELISEIINCRFISDKIALVNENVHSLRDMSEILNICFWGDELIQLFQTLSSTEIALLNKLVMSKSINWQSDTGWEEQLKKFINNSNKIKQ